MSIKQAIVIRKLYPDKDGKLKTIRTGKIVAQACHASIAFITSRIRNKRFTNLAPVKVIFKQQELDWINGIFTKICLQVNSEDELLDIYEKAKLVGLECHLITDNGLTEFNGIPTNTCLAIGPDDEEKINPITKELKLY
jgi:PTH2 family peptidyl-tRNA hydrolase